MKVFKKLWQTEFQLHKKPDIYKINGEIRIPYSLLYIIEEVFKIHLKLINPVKFHFYRIFFMLGGTLKSNRRVLTLEISGA